MNLFLDWALYYASRGWKIHPLHSVTDGICSCRQSKECGKNAGKHPRLSGWQNEASSDPQKIRYWWRRYPNANIGLMTGPESGIIVIDQDTATGAAYLGTNGLPDAPTVSTGRGKHYFFAHPGQTVRNLSLKKGDDTLGIDSRGDAGNVVLPPSAHWSGKHYEWLTDLTDWPEFPQPPTWWLDALAPARPKPKQLELPSPPPPSPPTHNGGGRQASSSGEPRGCDKCGKPTPDRRFPHCAGCFGGIRRERWFDTKQEAWLDELSKTAKGGRHTALRDCAFQLGRLIGHNHLTRSEAERLLEEHASGVFSEFPKRSESTMTRALDAGESKWSTLIPPDFSNNSSTNGHHQMPKAPKSPKKSTNEIKSAEKAPESEEKTPLSTIIEALTAKREDKHALKSTALELIDECIELDRAQLSKLSLELEKLGAGKDWIVRDFRPAVMARKKEIQTTPTINTDGEQSKSWPYSTRDGQIIVTTIRLTRYGPQPTESVVCDFVAKITTIINDRDGTTYRIEGEAKRGGKFTIDLGGEQFADDNRLRTALTMGAGPLSPVRAGQTKHLRPAIQLLTDEIETVKRFSRTGWHDGQFMIPGYAEAEFSLPRKLAYCLPKEADLEKGLTALDNLIRVTKPECSTVALTYILQAPLGMLMGRRNDRYGFFIKGRTGSFKTAWSTIAMCLWGNFAEKGTLLKWGQGATPNALMQLATYVGDAPMLIDNYKPNTGGGERAFVGLIHNIIEGSEKDRLDRTSKLKESHTIEAWPLCTGEDIPDTDAASLARLLVVEFPSPAKRHNQALATARELAPHLPVITRVWLDWLQTEKGKDFIENMKIQFSHSLEQWVKRLEVAHPNMQNMMRVASSLTMNELAWQTLIECPRISDILIHYAEAYHRGIQSVANKMAESTTTAFEASRFLEALETLISTGRAILLRVGSLPPEYDKDRVIGWKTETKEIYLNPLVARSVITRVLGPGYLGNVSNRTLYAQLSEIGAIASSDKNKSTTKRTVARGHRAKIIHLVAGTLPVTANLIMGESDEWISQ